MMVVTCDSCSKKYRIDETKIKSGQAKLKCKNCDHYIIVKNPNFDQPNREFTEFESFDTASEPGESSFFQSNGFENEPSLGQEPPASSSMNFSSPAVEKPKKTKSLSTERKGLGLKGQLFVYLFVPFLVIFVAAIFVSIWQLTDLVSSISKESSAIVSEFAEDAIADNARSVAKQLKVYFDSHPSMVDSSELLQNDPEIKAIALQKVGKTGYSVLLGYEGNGVKTWVHPNERIVGSDIMETIKGDLGENYGKFKKIVDASRGGKESRGYYLWREPNGALREKYLMITPVPHMDYAVSSTTYIDEFTQPNQRLISDIEKSRDRALWYQTGGMIVLLVLLAALVFRYGRNLTNRITDLSEVVDRISLGELEIEIKSQAKDEIGQLSEAISRMQDSLRLSIERLRRRRKKMN